MSGAPIPKPLKRGPKPRKPIKRSSKPIARKSRPAPVRRSESGRAKSAADREWSRAVLAKGPCAALGRWGHIACFGRIDPAHIQSRRYLATRHDVSNGLPLCRFIHDWFGRRPEEFEAFVRSRIGDAEYERLRLKAIQGPKLHQTPSRPSIQPSQLDEARAGIEGRGSVTYFAETRFGFDYGSAKVERLTSDEKRGWVYIQIYGMRGDRPRGDVQVYVTRGGKIRVFSRDGAEWKKQAKGEAA